MTKYLNNQKNRFRRCNLELCLVTDDKENSSISPNEENYPRREEEPLVVPLNEENGTNPVFLHNISKQIKKRVKILH